MSELGKFLYFDLEKAKRDVSKLVQVQRMVTRNGKTFPQTVYILPAQVKPTDRVISGQQNLINKVPKPSKGVWDQKYWDYVSNDPSKRDEALDYLKNSLGIDWTEVKGNRGINLMRAKMALNNYLKANNLQGNAAGSSVGSKTSALSPQKANLGTQSNKVSTQPIKANPAASGQTGSNPTTKVDDAISKIGLNYVMKQTTRDALKQCKNGREMIEVLKAHEGKDSLKGIAENSLGVTWTHVNHPGIESMRMQMAMYKYLDDIMGTESPVGSIQRGTASPKAGVANKPKTTQPSAPVPPSDKIPIPKNATQRQINIINVINGITSEADLEAYAKIGMVAEDDTARDWLMNKGLPRYQKWAAAHSSITNAKVTSGNTTRNNGNTAYGFGDQMAYDLKYYGQHKKIITDVYSDLYQQFDMSMFTNPTDAIKPIHGADNEGNSFGNTYSILNNINGNFSTYAADDGLTMEMMDAGSGNFAEKLAHETNLGYNGLNHDKMSMQYDLEKEGFVRYLRKVSSDNAGNAEIQDEVNQMISSYKEMLDMCGGDRNLLYSVLKINDGELDYGEDKFAISTGWRSMTGRQNLNFKRLLSQYEQNGQAALEFEHMTPTAAQIMVDIMDHKYNRMIEIMQSNGMTPNDIFVTLTSDYNDDADKFELYTYDESTGSRDRLHTTVDLTKDNKYMDFPHTNGMDASNLKDCAKDLSSSELRYYSYRFLQENKSEIKFDYNANIYSNFYALSESTNSKLTMANDVFTHIKAISELSTDDVKKIKNTCNGMFGIKIVDSKYNEIGIDHPEYYKSGSSFSFSSDYTAIGTQTPTNAETTVMANLLFTNLMCQLNTSAATQSSENTRSKINDDGWDYSGNFDWYSANAIDECKRGRYSGWYNNGGVSESHRDKQCGGINSNNPQYQYNADELNSQIDKQLQRVPVLTPEYIQNVHDFYEDRASINAGGGPVAAEDVRKDAKSFTFKSVGIVIDDYKSSPLKDVLYQFSTSYSKNIPKMVETGEANMEARIAKNLDYLPFDYQSDTQMGLKESKGKKPNQTAVLLPQLRKKREELLKKTKCTVAVEDEDTSLQMRKNMLKRWDYNPGDKDCDGNTITSKKYDGTGMYGDDRRILFNTRFFKIKNSNFHDNYDAYREKLASQAGTVSNDCTVDNRGTANITEMELYHGCPVECVAGIIGVNGGWMGAKGSGISAAQQARAGGSGQALGPGAYFGDRGGKSWVYAASSSYSMQYSGINDSNKDGMMVLCKVMRGMPSGGSFSHDEDSTSDHGRFNAFELAVHNNDCIYPHHFVEVSARSLGKNVTRDSNGNYLDANGNITHDRYGKSVTMK